jgi:hypothetical protein
MLGVAYDDGPTASSPVLYEFLEAHNQSSTHFMIGGNIAQLPDGDFSFHAGERNRRRRRGRGSRAEG